jgi:hypothetical protein
MERALLLLSFARLWEEITRCRGFRNSIRKRYPVVTCHFYREHLPGFMTPAGRWVSGKGSV